MNHRLLSMCDGLVEHTHVAIELGAKLKGQLSSDTIKTKVFAL